MPDGHISEIIQELFSQVGFALKPDKSIIYAKIFMLAALSLPLAANV